MFDYDDDALYDVDEPWIHPVVDIVLFLFCDRGAWGEIIYEWDIFFCYLFHAKMCE